MTKKFVDVDNTPFNTRSDIIDCQIEKEVNLSQPGVKVCYGAKIFGDAKAKVYSNAKIMW